MGWGPKAPDTSGMNDAARISAETGRDAMEWFTGYVDRTEPDRQAAAESARRVSDAQVQGMQFATQQAQRDQQRRQTVFEPLENELVADSRNYDTPDRRAEAVATASADVERLANTARSGAVRDIMRRGGTVDSGQGAMMDLAMQKAKMTAGATRNAVRNVEQQGYARRVDAASLGRNLPATQATQQQIATGAGGAAVGASNAALAATHSAAPMMQAGYSMGMQGQQVAGNLYGQAARIQAGDDGGMSGLMGGVGGIMQGLGAMGYSSKKLKTGKRDLDENEALAAVNASEVEGWNYKPGVADGGTHVGAYAEDMQRTMGDKTAPGGKVVDMQRIAKTNSKAISALTKMLEKLEAELAELEA